MKTAKSNKWYIFPKDAATRQYLESLRIGLRETAKPQYLPCGENQKTLELWSPPHESGYHFAARVWIDKARMSLNFQIFQSIGDEKPMPWEFPKKHKQEEATYRGAAPGVLVHLIR